MPTRMIAIHFKNKNYLFAIEEEDDIGLHIWNPADDSYIDIGCIINGASSVELGTWDREGDYLQQWHELSDT